MAWLADLMPFRVIRGTVRMQLIDLAELGHRYSFARKVPKNTWPMSVYEYILRV